MGGNSAALQALTQNQAPQEPVVQPVQRPQSYIYQPQYQNYGLGATPQAQQYFNYGNQMPTLTRPQAPPPQAQQYFNYGNQMPTFTRPQAPPPQSTYRMPYMTMAQYERLNKKRDSDVGSRAIRSRMTMGGFGGESGDEGFFSSRANRSLGLGGDD